MSRRRGPALRRLLWSALTRLPEFRITRRTRHGVLGFSSRDRGVGRILFLQGEYEYDQIERAAALGGFASGGRGWLLDVGANVGTVCIALAREGAFARALAVEPAPDTFRHLVKNVARNSLGHAISCVNVALSATSGTAELELSRNSGDHRVRVARPLADERYHEHTRPLVRVPLRRLDDLLDESGVAWRDVGRAGAPRGPGPGRDRALALRAQAGGRGARGVRRVPLRALQELLRPRPGGAQRTIDGGVTGALQATRALQELRRPPSHALVRTLLDSGHCLEQPHEARQRRERQ